MQYLIQVSLILIGLTTIYYFILKGLTFYRLNRVMLILIVLVSLSIPLIEFDLEVSNESRVAELLVKNFSEPIELAQIPAEIVPPKSSEEVGLIPSIPKKLTEEKRETSFAFNELLIAIYLIGVVAFLTLIVKNLVTVVSLKHKAEKVRFKDYNLLLCDTQQPFSFFSLIFISKEHLERSDIHVILKHESIHGREFHSIDALFFELLKSVLWFNPFVYYLSRQSRLNNEFLTDKLITDSEGIDVYSNALLNLGRKDSPTFHQLSLVNNFALLSLKPRVMQLVKKPSDSKWKISYLSFIPLLIIFLLLFSCNLQEEVGKSGVIKSITGIYFDEYGDQGERTGTILIDLHFDINGDLKTEKRYPGSTPPGLFNDLKYQLDFVGWKEDANIIKFNKEWSHISDQIERFKVEKEVNFYNSRNISSSKSVIVKEHEGARIYLMSGEDVTGYFRSNYGTASSFDLDEKGRVIKSYFHVYQGKEQLQMRIESIKKSLEEKRNTSEDIKNKIEYIEFLQNMEEFSKAVSGAYFYNNLDQLIEYNSITDLGSVVGKRTFEYDDFGRLKTINQFNKEEHKTASYTLVYSDDNIEEVHAYNGKGEFEYTVKYKYTYH